MAQKRDSEAQKTIRLYLPTDWVQAGFDADLRGEKYESLRGRTIPEALIEAVSGFAYHSEIVWHAPPQPNSIIRDDQYDIIYLIGPDAEKGERLAQTWAEPKTAGEALAFCLSLELEVLKRVGNSPVRSGGRLPPSTIAYIAFDLLEGYTVAPPGPYLQRLIRDLLKLSTAAQDQVSSYTSQQKAAYIMAQAPDLSLSSIASLAGVDRKTVSRWTREPEFKARVAQLCEFIKSPGWNEFKKRENRFQCIEVPNGFEK